MYVYAYVHTDTHKYAHMSIHTCICMCIHLSIYTYIYSTCILTYVHLNTRLVRPVSFNFPITFVQGEQFTFELSWGEQLSSVTCPVAVVCDLETGQEEVLPTDPFSDISVGQVCWSWFL